MIVSIGTVLEKIIFVRGMQVVLDVDLAEFYQVQTKHLNQTIARNSDRFPPEFAFRLSPKEQMTLSQQRRFSANDGRGGRRHLPYGFTREGVTMLSAILNTPRAVEVNTFDNESIRSAQ